MTIVLVRHGETAGNAARILQTPDVPLNERGRAQAALLAERIMALQPAHILSSDMLRALQTAAPISERTGLPVEQNVLLQERSMGDLRGTPYAELAFDPFAPDFVPPNGESWPAFFARVERAFAQLIEVRRLLSGPLVVVTHGLVCRSVARHHLSPSVDIPFDNTSVTVFEAEPPYVTTLLNCTEHLREGVQADVSGGAV